MKTEHRQPHIAEFSWQRKQRAYQETHHAKQKKTPVNKYRLRKPDVRTPIDPGVPNHQRHLARREFRVQSEALLRKMVAETKANHPDERMSYTQWKKLAMTETQAKLNQPLPA